MANAKEPPPIAGVQGKRDEPWVDLPGGRELARWGREDEIAYNQVNRSDLWWTNYPGGFQLDYQTYPNEQNLLLIAMNGDPTYDRRIIAYAGAISGGNACFSNDSDCRTSGRWHALRPNECCCWIFFFGRHFRFESHYANIF